MRRYNFQYLLRILFYLRSSLIVIMDFGKRKRDVFTEQTHLHVEDNSSRYPNMRSAEKESDRERSSFELSESGAVSLVVDTLQFHLDGLFSSSASLMLKIRSLSKIIDTISQLPTITLQSSGLSGKLCNVLVLLGSETDLVLLRGLVNLAFILCVDESGSFFNSPSINDEVIKGLLKVVITFNPKEVVHGVAEVVSSAAKFHSKRMFTSPAKVLKPNVPKSVNDHSVSVTTNDSPVTSLNLHSKRVFKKERLGTPRVQEIGQPLVYDDLTSVKEIIPVFTVQQIADDSLDLPSLSLLV